MESVESKEQVSTQAARASNASAVESGAITGSAAPLIPQGFIEPCPTCGGASPINGASLPFVYAIGEIDWRFPSMSLEQEFAQVLSLTNTKDMTELEAQKKVLTENRYIARQVCWVMKVEKLETYILQPRDPADYRLLVEALRPDNSRLDIDVVIGTRGPIAQPEMCGGLSIPVVFYDQVYSFDRPTLVKSIPKPPKAKVRAFENGAGNLFDRIQQINDNHGATDAHRAVNFLAVRSKDIYAWASDMLADGFWLSAIDTTPSRLSGTHGRNVLDVIFTYAHSVNRITKKSFVRVDVTGEFPFIVTELQDYFDR